MNLVAHALHLGGRAALARAAGHSGDPIMNDERLAARAPHDARSLAVAVAAALLLAAPLPWSATYSVVSTANAAEPPSATAPAAQRFATPADAVKALIAALEKDDVAAVAAVLGGDSSAVLDSGDPVADRAERKNFVARYRQKNALVQRDERSYTLEVGADAWPAPIPIVKGSDGKWSFDTVEGRQEIVYRRIGRNELGAIAVCEGFVDAQREYAAKSRDGQPAGIYASRLISTPGKHDGLYWETKPGEKASPVGPGLAAATAEGYQVGTQSPYHGYYFRMLKEQGPNASGGAMRYEVGGRLQNGYALIAYPAEYRVSGVMTFIVNQDGVVFQKDLGADTAKLAAAITAFDPDPSWAAIVDE
jgi:hypothetical protein